MSTASTRVRIAIGTAIALSSINAAGVQQIASTVDTKNAGAVNIADNTSAVAVAAPAVIVKGSGKFRVSATIQGVSGAGFASATVAIRQAINGGAPTSLDASAAVGQVSAKGAGHVDQIVATGAKVGDSVVFDCFVTLPSIGATNTLNIPINGAQINVEEIPN